jgi:hypothetical protein
MQRDRRTAGRPVIEPLEPRRQLTSGAAGLVRTTALLSQPRSELGSAVIGTEALFGGGATAPPGESGAVDVYDAVAGTWSTLTLPRPRYALAATALDRLVFFAGGSTVDHSAQGTEVDALDVASGTWSSLTLPHARVYFAAAAMGHLAIFAGGADANSPAGAVADVFDADTQQWSSDSLPVPSIATSMAIAGSKLFLAPGETGVADVYDSQTGNWSALKLPITTVRGIVASVGTKVLFAGGYDDPGGPSRRVAIYDTLTDRWTNTILPRQSGPLTATTIGTKVLFVSGERGVTGPFSDLVDVYNAATGRWSTTPLSAGRDKMAATTVGRQAIFAGGETSYLVPTAAVDIFTDKKPTAVLSGTISGTAGGDLTITVTNTGDADLRAGATVTVYAARGRALHRTTPLGRVTLDQPLAAGDSLSVTVPTAIPRGLAAGDYRLLAAVKRSSREGSTPIAAQSETFTVGHRAGAAPAGAATTTSRFRSLFAR